MSCQRVRTFGSPRFTAPLRENRGSGLPCTTAAANLLGGEPPTKGNVKKSPKGPSCNPVYSPVYRKKTRRG